MEQTRSNTLGMDIFTVVDLKFHRPDPLSSVTVAAGFAA